MFIYNNEIVRVLISRAGFIVISLVSIRLTQLSLSSIEFSYWNSILLLLSISSALNYGLYTNLWFSTIEANSFKIKRSFSYIFVYSIVLFLYISSQSEYYSALSTFFIFTFATFYVFSRHIERILFVALLTNGKFFHSQLLIYISVLIECLVAVLLVYLVEQNKLSIRIILPAFAIILLSLFFVRQSWKLSRKNELVAVSSNPEFIMVSSMVTMTLALSVERLIMPFTISGDGEVKSAYLLVHAYALASIGFMNSLTDWARAKIIMESRSKRFLHGAESAPLLAMLCLGFAMIACYPLISWIGFIDVDTDFVTWLLLSIGSTVYSIAVLLNVVLVKRGQGYLVLLSWISGLTSRGLFLIVDQTALSYAASFALGAACVLSTSVICRMRGVNR